MKNGGNASCFTIMVTYLLEWKKKEIARRYYPADCEAKQ
jgi:hypothetical protein